MALKDIKEGSYIAKVNKARLVVSKEGTPAMEVMFTFTNPETKLPENIAKPFWLSDKAIDGSMETLVKVLAYNGSEEVDENGILTDPKAFTSSEVQIVIQMREISEKAEDGTYVGTGKFAPEVRFVNLLGNMQAVDKKAVAQVLQKVNFRAKYLAAKKEAGLPVEDEAPSTPSIDPSDVPF